MLVVLPLEGFATAHEGQGGGEEQQRDGDTEEVEHRIGLLSKGPLAGGTARGTRCAARAPPDYVQWSAARVMSMALIPRNGATNPPTP